jgi:ABC-type multidrug transport system fused ATPase/permease subunit
VFLTHFFSQKEYINKNRKYLSLFVWIGVLKNCTSFLLSVSIGEFFTLRFHSSGSKGKLLKMIGIKIDTLESFFIFFSLLIILRAIFEYFENYVITIQGEKFVMAIREQIFSNQMSWDSERFREKHFGNYLLRYSNDMKAVQNYLTKGVMGGVKDVLFLFMGLVLLSFINLKLTLAYTIMVFVSITIVFLLGKKQRHLVEQSRAKRSNLLSHVTKSFQRHRKIKELSDEQQATSKFSTASELLYLANISNHQFESLLNAVFSFFQYTMIAVVLLMMNYREITHIHKGDALVFILIIMLMNSHLKKILKVPAILNKGIVSFDKINKLLTNEIAE